MGSGHLPVDGFGKSAYFHNLLQFADVDLVNRDADNAVRIVTNPGCYDLQMKDKDARYGVNFFYGGPGYSDLCLK
ncbi:hypothetical protein ACJRO7_005653 [Eucalyptus globulus]|uniref:Neprosin PEP catalytic domain-containing protein n=1 Tax=Eucalyptus globulus TaxID=34317 RepID=A0ABD3J394_EUCGL